MERKSNKRSVQKYQRRKKRKINKITNRVNPYLPWDVLELCLEHENLYKKLLQSNRYEFSWDVKDFLSVYRCKTGSRYEIRQNYIQTFRDYRARRISMADLKRMSEM